MKQGTISVLVGCHSPVHSLLVTKAWKKTHGQWPELWELVCIFLHDLGHWGKNYLDDPKLKAEHWRLGAELARYLFGESGYRLCAGHCQDSGFPQSSMYLPDKRSWAEAPTWWLVLNCLVEPPIHGKDPILKHVRKFQAWTAANMERSTPQDTHNAFLKMAKEGGRL